MFSFIKKLFSKPLDHLPIAENDAGETVIDEYKMSLEERKAWRLEMLRMSVKEVFTELQFSSGMHRYRAVALDRRGHYYAVMVETTARFEEREYVDLAVIEKKLQEMTFKNYGVVVDAVYWKANKQINMFRRATDKLELPTPADKPAFSDTQPMEFAQPTAAELAQFRAAIAGHRRTAPLSVKGRRYSTDLSPLGDN